MPETTDWRTLKPGDLIIEKHKQAITKTVNEVVPEHYVIATGFNKTRIAWRNLNRYRIVDRAR
jgi:hypothetical protein